MKIFEDKLMLISLLKGGASQVCRFVVTKTSVQALRFQINVFELNLDTNRLRE